MAQNQAPAGWYPDPRGSGRQVWWDGTNWQPTYPPPGAVGGYQQPSRTNGLAVASLVLGLLTFCGIGSVLAIIFGFSALSSIKHDPTQRGRGMAIAGVTLGFLAIGAVLFIAGVSLIGNSSSTKFSTVGNLP